MKKIIPLLSISIIVSIILTACSSSITTSYDDDSYDSNNKYVVDNDSYDDADFKDDTNDWMKDYAEDKDYDYDDGGSYYCMGKNDTCNNKTKNAYDLYCSSCDPDGDNSEG